MKLLVLYGEEDRIISLRRVRLDENAGAGAPMRSGVQPGKGQRLEEFALEPAFDGWSLKDRHEQFSVVDQDGRRKLIHRAKASTSA